MEREPNSFEPRRSPDVGDSNPDEWIVGGGAGLRVENDDKTEAALAEADADIAAGRAVPHEEVARWLATWGTPADRPAPREWFE